MPLKSYMRNMPSDVTVNYPIPRMCHKSHSSSGAHSWVRRTLGITMDGEQTGEVSLVTCFSAVY